MAKKKISPINEDFDFKLFVTIARKNAVWLMTFMFLSVFTALGILHYTAPVYETSAIVKIANVNNAENVLGISAQSSRLYETNDIAGDIELIRSKIIVGRSLARLPLQASYFAKGEVLINELYQASPFKVSALIRDSSICGTPIYVDLTDSSTLIVTYASPVNGEQMLYNVRPDSILKLKEADIQIRVINPVEMLKLQEDLSRDAYFFTLNNLVELTDDILGKLTVSVLNMDAKTVSIKIREKNIFKAADIANAITVEFNEFNVEKKSEVADKVLNFIDNTINNVNDDLKGSENSLEEFKRENKIIDPGSAITLVNDQLIQIQNERLKIEQQLATYIRIRKEVRTDSDIGQFLLGMTVNTNSIILEQMRRLQDIADQRDMIRIQATEKSEIYKATKQRLENNRLILAQTLDNEITQLKAQLIQLDKQLTEFEIKFGKIPAQQAEYGRLKRAYDINEKFYSLLLEKKAEFSITKAGFVPQHLVLQAARSNLPPVSPNKPLIISASLMIGFVLSFILIIVRYLLYNEINALDEVGLYTDAALLGIVPKYKRDIPVSQLLVDKNPKSVISEAFRSIRTNLQFISNEDGAKTVAVTSTISGEGKTFNAINLAGVIAFSGKKVVILDFDMRKPKIHLGFNVENKHGVSTLLIGKDTPENCIIHSSLSNLDFITAGPIPPNPAELIISAKMEELLSYLKERYDIIIIDLPPVGIVSDGIPIMQRADYPLYILRANYSRKMFIAQINKLMTENKITNLSIILNSVEMSRARYGYGYNYSYGYGYGYGYSYGYGYYDEDDKPNNFLDKVAAKLRKKPN
jgi:capsular exopolysaccharide synthesis family protein